MFDPHSQKSMQQLEEARMASEKEAEAAREAKIVAHAKLMHRLATDAGVSPETLAAAYIADRLEQLLKKMK